MPDDARIMLNIQIDCEATQHALRDALLGERAIRGLEEILAATGTKATFAVIPSDMRAHANIYRELEAAGHEMALHLHPAEEGYDEFMGAYGPEEQREMLQRGIDVFGEALGHRPLGFTPGYASANDYTFPVLESLGFTHGTVSIPTRNLPQCACIWGNSPRDLHYPHRYNRCLSGDVDFVEVPVTVDPDSRMWGGSHPQDLRVELVDAKNHWYTIAKNVRRQREGDEAIPVKYLKILTHNVFEYGDPHNFRRETLIGMIQAARDICLQQGCALVSATTADIAAEYRRLVSRPPKANSLTLDTRGRMIAAP